MKKETEKLLFRLFLALIFVLIALSGGIIVFIGKLPVRPSTQLAARVAKIYLPRPRGGATGDLVTVEFRTQKGLEGQGSRTPGELNCKVGDIITATQQGLDLTLNSNECTNRKPSPWR